MTGQPLHVMATTEGQTKSFMEKVDAKRRGTEIPLSKDACTGLSIYLLKADGTLWTIKRTYRRDESGQRHEVAEPYKQVRDYKQPVACDVYVCVCCEAQSVDIEKLKHKQAGLRQASDPSSHPAASV